MAQSRLEPSGRSGYHYAGARLGRMEVLPDGYRTAARLQHYLREVLVVHDVPRFLDDICVKLGICLEPGARARITIRSFRDPDEFELAVLEAEGLDPLTMSRHLRHQLREMILRYWD